MQKIFLAYLRIIQVLFNPLSQAKLRFINLLLYLSNINKNTFLLLFSQQSMHYFTKKAANKFTSGSKSDFQYKNSSTVELGTSYCRIK